MKTAAGPESIHLYEETVVELRGDFWYLLNKLLFGDFGPVPIISLVELLRFE